MPGAAGAVAERPVLDICTKGDDFTNDFMASYEGVLRAGVAMGWPSSKHEAKRAADLHEVEFSILGCDVLRGWK